MNEDKKDRYKRIVTLLSQGGELTVHDIAQVLDVSEMTVRRDLSEMEADRIVERTHGAARIFNPSSLVRENYVVSEQMQKSFQQKNLIGLKAASMVSAHETIFLDSGSTTPFIARYLDKDMPVTVLCYTFLNALELYNRKNTNLILSGGFFDKDSTVFHSSNAATFLKGIRADKAFISAAGVDERLGLTTFFYFEADIKKLMMLSARQIVLVVDSTKFGKSSVSHFGELEQVNVVITDAGVPDEARAMLREKGVELIIAE
jgi:DeoR family deoxyribose operon repressor